MATHRVNGEQELLSLVDTQEAMAMIQRFSTLVRESGTPDEFTAADYIVERLKAHDVPVHVYEPELLISLPRGAAVHVEGPDGPMPFRAKTVSFSLSTGDIARTGELVYLPASKSKSVTDIFNVHVSSDAPDIRGRIAVTEGFAMPSTVRALEQRGAIAQIYVNPGKNIHEGICTTIWGSPTLGNVDRKPATPIACVNRPDGERLIAMCRGGGVRASVSTQLEEGWMRCALPVATIDGTSGSDEFLLVHGHYDSWHVGIGDNATGDATLLELARIFQQGRQHLRRTIRVAWWPAHSTGRYAGSTWYADTFAMELRKHCIGQVDIDSPGCRNATAFEEVMWMMECDQLCRDAIRDRTGKESQRLRPLRAGDYSFNQIGLSSFFMLLSNRPLDERLRLGFYPVGGCGGDIAWHTEEDTLEVADRGIIRQDLEIYVTALARVANAPVLPYDFRDTAREMRAGIDEYRMQASDGFSLAPVYEELDRLDRALDRLYAAVPGEDGDADLFNRTLMELARRLVPLNYAFGDRFDHDPAESLGVIPKLRDVAMLAKLKRDSDQWKMLQTGLVRARNMVANAMYEASEVANGAVASMAGHSGVAAGR
jgi:N-acetylated-alpha-linked acidic dipeptidase